MLKLTCAVFSIQPVDAADKVKGFAKSWFRKRFGKKKEEKKPAEEAAAATPAAAAESEGTPTSPSRLEYECNAD